MPCNKKGAGGLEGHKKMMLLMNSHSFPSWILSKAENLASSSLQDGVTDWYYYCQKPADRLPDHLNVWWPVSQFSRELSVQTCFDRFLNEQWIRLMCWFLSNVVSYMPRISWLSLGDGLFLGNRVIAWLHDVREFRRCAVGSLRHLLPPSLIPPEGEPHLCTHPSLNIWPDIPIWNVRCPPT